MRSIEHASNVELLPRLAGPRPAFLLSNRLRDEAVKEVPLLDTPERVADFLREPNRLCSVEHMQVICRNTRRRLIAVENVAQGLLDQVLVHAREVFAVAIAKRASAIILAHNHPSGDPTPSEADIRVTRDLIRAGQLLKIEVLDHVILRQRTTDRPRDFCSLRELGYASTRNQPPSRKNRPTRLRLRIRDRFISALVSTAGMNTPRNRLGNRATIQERLRRPSRFGDV